MSTGRKRRKPSRQRVLLYAVLRNNEKSVAPSNHNEQLVIWGADKLRKIVRSSDALKDAIVEADMVLGMEMMIFLIRHSNDENLATAVVLEASHAGSDLRPGLLDEIYDYCITNSIPPEWAVPMIMTRNSAPVGSPEEKTEGFVINPKGLKI